MTLTANQRRVLEWLEAFPGVHLTGGQQHVTWSAAWVNGQARRNLREFCGVLEADPGFTTPNTAQFADWPTPKCTMGTFLALFHAGYVTPVGYVRGDPFNRSYTISESGSAALQADRDAGIPIEPEMRDRWPSVRCECGWLGYVMGGHKQSTRHKTWLAVQEYSANVRAQNAAVSV